MCRCDKHVCALYGWSSNRLRESQKNALINWETTLPWTLLPLEISERRESWWQSVFKNQIIPYRKFHLFSLSDWGLLWWPCCTNDILCKWILQTTNQYKAQKWWFHFFHDWQNVEGVRKRGIYSSNMRSKYCNICILSYLYSSFIALLSYVLER